MLRFLCEGFRGRCPPPDIQRKQIFDEYWKVKLKGTRSAKKAEKFLSKIVDEMIRRYTTELLEIDVENITGETIDSPFSTFSKIMSERIILYRDKRMGFNVIGFTYEAFFEYLIARYILIRERWIEKSEEDIISDFINLIKMSKDFRSLRGAIQQIVMYMEDENKSICISLINSLWQRKLDRNITLFEETIYKLHQSTVEKFIHNIPPPH